MKIKSWDITLRDLPSTISNSQLGAFDGNTVRPTENDEFYTTDTEAFLIFNLLDEDFHPTSATITLHNRTDGSVVNEDVDVIDGTITYEMRHEVIEHAGAWQAQLVYEQDKGGVAEKYTSKVVGFNVAGHLLDTKEPALVVIENWNNFVLSAESLIEDWEQNEALRAAAERERDAAEDSRVSEENKRASAESDRESAEGKRASTFTYNENSRKAEFEANEAVRQDNELVRQSQEESREVAENQREETIGSFSGRLDDLDKKIAQNAIIMGVEWDKQEDPTLTRIGGSKDFVANIGIGDEVVQNDFDYAPIYREITRETDDLGNTLVRIPRFYIRKTDDENFLRLEISKEKNEGFYLPCVFWDFENNKELDCFYYGAYDASLSTDGTKLESKPGAVPLASRNIVEFRNFAQSNGSGYQQTDIHAVDVLQTLFRVEFATLNSQLIHPGYTGGTEAKLTGGTDGVVASSGAAGADNTHQFMYRGIEDLWGNLNQWVDGVNFIDNQAWVCEDADSYASNVFAAPYQKLSYVNADTNSYIKEMGFDPSRPYAQFPVTLGAGTATYYSDYYQQSTDQSVATSSGNWSRNLAAGVSYWNLSLTSSNKYNNTGGRLLKKPL